MSNVIHRITKQYLVSVNTPDYPTSEWIINPTLPSCDPIYWVIEGDTVREMTQAEKDELEYSTNSTVYMIDSKTLKYPVNGHDYEDDYDAIINPIMPSCDIKFTKVDNYVVVEMDETEKKQVLSDEWEKTRRDRINFDIEKDYPISTQLYFLTLGIKNKNDPTYVAFMEYLESCEANVPEDYTCVVHDTDTYIAKPK